MDTRVRKIEERELLKHADNYEIYMRSPQLTSWLLFDAVFLNTELRTTLQNAEQISEVDWNSLVALILEISNFGFNVCLSEENPNFPNYYRKIVKQMYHYYLLLLSKESAFRVEATEDRGLGIFLKKKIPMKKVLDQITGFCIPLLNDDYYLLSKNHYPSLCEYDVTEKRGRPKLVPSPKRQKTTGNSIIEEGTFQSLFSKF